MNNNTAHQKILQYSRSQTRNKLIFFRDCMDEITPVDLGLELSVLIINYVKDPRIAMHAAVELKKLLDSSLFYHREFGKILAIKNIGILLEPELKFDISRILDVYSQNNMLFVHWEGEIDQEYLYFLSKEKGIKINIKNLSHIVI